MAWGVRNLISTQALTTRCSGAASAELARVVEPASLSEAHLQALFEGWRTWSVEYVEPACERPPVWKSNLYGTCSSSSTPAAACSIVALITRVVPHRRRRQ